MIVRWCFRKQQLGYGESAQTCPTLSRCSEFLKSSMITLHNEVVEYFFERKAPCDLLGFISFHVREQHSSRRIAQYALQCSLAQIPCQCLVISLRSDTLRNWNVIGQTFRRGHRHHSREAEQCAPGGGYCFNCLNDGASEDSDDGWYSFHRPLPRSPACQGRPPGIVKFLFKETMAGLK